MAKTKAAAKSQPQLAVQPPTKKLPAPPAERSFAAARSPDGSTLEQHKLVGVIDAGEGRYVTKCGRKLFGALATAQKPRPALCEDCS
jgi:hypothetical protein